MPVTTAATAFGMIKGVYDLAAGALSLKSDTKRDLAIAELLPKLLEAQIAANGAVQQEAALLQRIRDLEEDNRQLKARAGQLESYEARRFAPGSVAYVKKGALPASADAHPVCANCYQDREKVVSLQPTAKLGSRRHRIHMCPSCKTEFELGPEMKPDEGPHPPEPPRKIAYPNQGIA